MTIAILLLSSTSYAGTITFPDGLNIGDQYRLAFVTSTTRDATSSNIADYNDFVSAAANAVPSLAALGTTWTAIASTATGGSVLVNAKDNTSTDDSPAGNNGVPIYLVDGSTIIADHYDGLWDGSLDHALNMTETGGAPSEFSIWTGTLGNGAGEPGNGLGGGGFGGVTGQFKTSLLWTEGFPVSYGDELHLYGISGTLTVAAVPIPADV
ncbi:MAG: PEP-CTERM sorting domain-containing protein [bacterium]|nr:PEP-CTERM sorting domain-containing protein [bacterium]